jgi:beta-phosphoglucomutase-like phosphatase (HAD superfamily)
VRRMADTIGFEVLPRRWVVERTLAWLNRNRRLAKDFEATIARCLALEDSHNGVRSASSAGMMTIMVPDLLEPTDEIRGLCTFVARDLHGVRRAVLAAISRQESQY